MLDSENAIGQNACVRHSYDGRLYGFGEFAFGGVGVLILRMPSPSQMYLPVMKMNDDFII